MAKLCEHGPQSREEINERSRKLQAALDLLSLDRAAQMRLWIPGGHVFVDSPGPFDSDPPRDWHGAERWPAAPKDGD